MVGRGRGVGGFGVLVAGGGGVSVLVGVGAAFDFHAGVVKQAPAWMQKAGLEWLFRFIHEAGRLWKRYLHHNPRFVILSLLEQIRYWSGKKEKGE